MLPGIKVASGSFPPSPSGQTCRQDTTDCMRSAASLLGGPITAVSAGSPAMQCAAKNRPMRPQWSKGLPHRGPTPRTSGSPEPAPSPFRTGRFATLGPGLKAPQAQTSRRRSSSHRRSRRLKNTGTATARITPQAASAQSSRMVLRIYFLGTVRRSLQFKRPSCRPAWPRPPLSHS